MDISIDLSEKGLVVEYVVQDKEEMQSYYKPEEQDRPSTATLSKRISIEDDQFRSSTFEGH